MSSHRVPSVAKQSSSLAGRIKPIFPSSRRWSSIGRENYRIIPRKSPIQTGLDRVAERSRRTSCMGFALFAPLFSFCFRQCRAHADGGHKINLFHLLRTTRYGNWLPGLAAHLIPHHQLIQHSLIWRPNLHLAWPGRPSHTVNKTDISYHQIKNSIIPLFPFARMMSV